MKYYILRLITVRGYYQSVFLGFNGGRCVYLLLDSRRLRKISVWLEDFSGRGDGCLGVYMLG